MEDEARSIRRSITRIESRNRLKNLLPLARTLRYLGLKV